MTSISKNVYIDKLDDIFNKYINTYHSAIRIYTYNTYIQYYTYNGSGKELITKILNLKLIIQLEYQKINTFLKKAMFQIGLRKFL